MGFFSTKAGQSSIGSGIDAVLGLAGGAFTANQQKQLLKGQANISAQQSKDALALEQERTKQAQLQLDALTKKGEKSGGNTLLYVGLGVGAVVILGVVIFAVTRNK